jgi:heme oxygenase
MNTDPPEQQRTLMEELKSVTSAEHARLEVAPYFEALAACRLPLESYVGLLRALAMMHCVLEPALESSVHPGVRAVWRSEMRKVALLESDLRYFAPRAVADVKEAVEEACGVVERVRLWTADQPVALLGCWYVLEGSTLGGTLLCRQYARNFLFEGGKGIAYVSSYSPNVHEHWQQFQQRMNVFGPLPREREQILEAAGEFFRGIEAVFRALYPFRFESRTYLVTSINPEAGRHPVPTDLREVEASLKAADRCWQEFPYLSERYGERGHRFTRSDSAWLATLGQYETARVCEQVCWLGRLLAARGIPTLLLEIQLKMLFEEMVAALPERRSNYEKLLAAGADLRASRQKYLDDEQLSLLSDAFDRAVGAELSRRIPSAGRLLGAAVADETGGHESAVESVRSWMCDASRFAPEWVSAVEATVEQARKLTRT